MKSLALAEALIMTMLAACGGAGDSADEPNGGSDQLVGTFLLSLVSPQAERSGYTSMFGKVFDGPTPSPILWEEASKNEYCRLLTPRVPHCQESCGATAICAEDDQCQAYPASLAVGTVTVTGVQTKSGESSFSMDPIVDNYQPVGLELAYPAFAAGDPIGVSAAGAGAVSAFAIQAQGIADLELLNPAIEFATGQAVTLSWTPPAAVTASDIFVKVDISHHGGTKGLIECQAPDAGSLELSAEMLDALTALGSSGFPYLSISRKALGSVVTSVGRVDLAIVSTVNQEVSIPGLVSCNQDQDCPLGQICRDDLKCE